MISQKRIDRIKTIGFLFIIGLPLFLTVAGVKTGELQSENVNVMRPSISWNFTQSNSLYTNVKSGYVSIIRYINLVDFYYSTTFPFRKELLTTHNKIKEKVFKIDPLPRKVVRGSNGWYFLGETNGNVITETKGMRVFSPNEITALQSILRAREAWLQQMGIKNYLAVAPDKLSVYGSHLPINNSGRKTKLKQIEELCGDSIAFVDLKQDFPDSEDLFIKTDTHWNDYGAFVAYKTLIKRIKRDLPFLSELEQKDFSVDTVLVMQQDLTKMLDEKVPDKKIVYKSVAKESSILLLTKSLPIPRGYNLEPENYEKRFKGDSNKLKVLVFRDSFTSNLEKYLKESFGEVVFIWRHEFDKALIEVEKPDVIIQIIVERELDLLLRENW